MSKWQIILFTFGAVGLGCTLMKIWLRWDFEKKLGELKKIMVPNIQILEASYGGDTIRTDATEVVKKLIKDGIYNVVVDSTQLELEDKQPGVTKTLKVRYLLGGEEKIVTAKDYENLALF